MNKNKMDELFKERFFDDKCKYLIVIGFWEWVLSKPNEFKYRIHRFSEEIGYGTDRVGCNFPNIFESPDEEGYFEEGVEFYGWEEEIVIDYAMFVKCAELAYSIYSENYGKDEDIEKDIESMHKKYNV